MKFSSIILLKLVCFQVAYATTTTWTGNNSTNWNDSGNWDNGVPNSTSYDVVIASATNQPEIIGSFEDVNINGLTFTGSSPTLTVFNTAALGIHGALSGTGTYLVGGGTGGGAELAFYGTDASMANMTVNFITGMYEPYVYFENSLYAPQMNITQDVSAAGGASIDGSPSGNLTVTLGSVNVADFGLIYYFDVNTCNITSGTSTVKRLSGSGYLNFSGTQMTVTGTSLSGSNLIITLSPSSIFATAESVNNGLDLSTLVMMEPSTFSLNNGVEAATISLSGANYIDIPTVSTTGDLTGCTIQDYDMMTPGSYIKTGLGTLLLDGMGTGSFTYTGGTTINEGFISINDDSQLGDTSGTLSLTGGTLIASSSFSLNSARPITTSDALSGFSVSSPNALTVGHGIADGGSSGGITLSGGGALVFANNNSYSGGTTIADGTVQFTGGGSLNAVGSVTIGSTGVFDISGGSDQVIGDLISSDAGSQVVLGNNQLTFGSSGDQLFAGVISGAGNLVKSGSGTVTLSGTNLNSSGTSLVQSGILVVNGDLPSAIVTVASGAVLKGNGNLVGHITVQDGGAITPGNSVGDLSLGALTLNSGSITNIDIDPSLASQIQVSGAAVIDGTLNIIQETGSYPDSGHYLILTSSDTTGSFSNITGGFSGYKFSVYQMGNDLYLDYGAAIQNTITTANLSGNILKVANYLNKYAPKSEEYDTLTQLSGEELVKALNSVSPARNAFGLFTTQQTMFSLSDIIYSHLANRRFLNLTTPAKSNQLVGLLADNSNRVKNFTNNSSQATCLKKPLPYEIWASGFVEFSRQSAENKNPSFNFTSEGGMIAFDYTNHINSDMAGAALGYAHSQISDANGMGSSNIPYYFAVFYSMLEFNRFYIEPSFLGCFHQIHNKRHVSYTGVDATAAATINGWQIDPHLGFGYDYIQSDGRFSYGIEPFAALDWVINWENSFTESGAGALDMSQKSHTASMLQSEIGLRFYQSFCGSKGLFGIRESASYMNRTPFGTGSVTAAIIGSTSFMNLISLNQTENLAMLAVDLFAELGKKRDVLITLGYQGEFSSSYMSNEVLMRIGKQF